MLRLMRLISEGGRENVYEIGAICRILEQFTKYFDIIGYYGAFSFWRNPPRFRRIFYFRTSRIIYREGLVFLKFGPFGMIYRVLWNDLEDAVTPTAPSLLFHPFPH